MLKAISAVVSQLGEAGASVVGIRHGTEEPEHSVERLSTSVEIRRYGPRLAAETVVADREEAARNIGFRRLARYIFGGNHAGAKIAMTAPVSQRAGAEGNWLIRFFMPAAMESPPEPNDEAVKLVAVPAETVAVRRFSGSRSHSAVASQTAELMHTLHATGFEAIGTPAAWFYDPPWTIPILRRNEIAVPVKPNP